MDRFDPFVKYADVYGDIINWEKDPMNKPQNQNKYFFSDGKTYYEQICKMLRLMSVFKEAFNQIYSNEDEISEAWENFVNNLSASVVEGSEPDVTLTWTDDSVNFEFTMVPGVPGEQGVGITSISFNSDYTMTITLSDGNSYTSMSLKGETGPQGPQGETGSGLQILDVYATLADLQSAHPTGQPGDAYQVGSAGNYTLYIWSSSQSAWIPAGSLGTVSPSLSNPLMDGTASAGSQNLYSRGDHVHPTDTSRASKEELDALIKTSQSLIDQSFIYRESPAIQDGLARIDKIKGNTLAFNQLVNNGNFADTSGWQSNSWDSFTVSGNVGKIVATGVNRGAYAVVDLIQGHKYLLMAEVNSSQPMNIGVNELGGRTQTTVTNQYITVSKVATASAGGSKAFSLYSNSSSQNTMNVRNCMLIDLTLLNASYITDYNSFKSYFPLPYYSYQSTLLPFKGTSIKTVGKNLLTYSVSSLTTNGITFTPQNDGSVKVSGTATASAYYNIYNWANNTLFPLNKSLRLSGGTAQVRFTLAYRNANGTGVVEAHDTGNGATITIPSADKVIYLALRVLQGTTIDTIIYPMVTFADADQTYEPYTSSTTNLPTLTYFPNGMKSAGNVYDELTPTKAITRIGAIDLGSVTWTYNSTDKRFYANIEGVKPSPTNGTAFSSGLLTVPYQTIFADTPVSFGDMLSYIADKDMLIWQYTTGGGVANVNIKDTRYTDATAFKTAMNGIYLYFEMVTPIETAISPELDLSFNSYINGTEQLLPVNGSVPSTSPVIADMTYLSIDDAMEYIIDKLANVPQNTQQILDSLEDDVADLQTDVGALQPAVSALQTSVGNINTNIGQLSSTVAGHTSSISNMQSDISDLDNSITSLEGTIANHTSRIGTLESGLSATNGNVQSLSSQVQSIDGRVTSLESDLFKIVVKEFDYDTVASETNFGTTTPITQEEGYRVIGVVGTETQAGEHTSPASNIAITQCHVSYTSLGALIITIFGRNTGPSTKTNVRVYAYLLCIKDIQ